VQYAHSVQHFVCGGSFTENIQILIAYAEIYKSSLQLIFMGPNYASLWSKKQLKEAKYGQKTAHSSAVFYFSLVSA
jgi:hypothetical protein